MKVRILPAVAVVLAVALGLSGCGDGDRLAEQQPVDRSARPVVAIGQAATVIDAVDAALVRGRGETSGKRLGPRVVGPYRDLAIADATVAKKRKRKAAAAGDFSLTTVFVPAAASWPRFFVAVGDVQGAGTPVLRVLTSGDARTPYGLYAEAAMLPGATLPQVAAPDVGAATVAPDAAAGLAAAPRDVATRYAAFLNDGATKSALFRRSAFSDQVRQRLAADRKALKKVASVTSKHTASRSQPLALRTADGGALVVALLTQTYTLKPKSGRRVAITDKDLSALAGGKKEFAKSFTRTSVEVVVFDVPPAGRGEIQVVAAQKGDVKAVAK